VTLSEMREVLAKRDLQLTKSLGQNFLHDGNQLRRIVAAANLQPTDQVLEIGPGLGPLTGMLLVEAGTVFLALIGTTLSCMNTGARVTYAMGKDEEVPAHFGLLHDTNLSPHRAIWALAIISAIVGCISVMTAFGDDLVRRETADLGAVLLDKPFAMADLRATVLDLLRSRATR